VPFQIDAESSASAFFTWLGISREFQTGDESFDRQVYLGCDHPLLLNALQQHEPARQAILALLKLPGANKIWSDGTTLWFSRTCEHTSGGTEQQSLLQVVRALTPTAEATRKQPTPFFWRYLTIEAVVWGIFGYAGVSYLDLHVYYDEYQMQLDGFALIKLGMFVALGLFGLLMTLIVLFLRGSSRSHQIVIESLPLLLLALPLCGTQSVFHFNRMQDHAQAAMVLIPIKDMSRYKGKGSSYRYHLELTNPPSLFGTQVPQRIKVTEDIYRIAAVDKQLLLVVKPGGLGLPWYQRMDVYPQHAQLRAR
jgi:hypothetical protein